MKNWKFGLNDKVKLILSDEEGIVIGRAEYTDLADQYLVRYRDGSGRQSEVWWTEAAVVAA
ncbi:hypothetical protein WKW50_16185 [Ochrobactrum sp. GPK 3]